MTNEKPEIKITSPKPVPPPRVSFVVEEDIDSAEKPLPAYLESVYRRRYFSPRIIRFFSNGFMSAVSNCFMQRRLIRYVTDELHAGLNVLQFGIADGNLQHAIAEKMNGQGVYHIEDVSKPQINALLPSVSPWLNVRLNVRDFSIPTDKKYDVAVLFFTLHELPDAHKEVVLKRAFDVLAPHGKIVVVDYAMPCAYHPLKHPVRLFNRLFEPFAESLWYKDIQSFAPANLRESKGIIWAKSTTFGGLYQCVIAQKR